MKAQLLENRYKLPKTKLDYSRSLFNYKKTHSTNMLTGYIYPVAFFNLMPGDTPPNKFGFQLQSAPLLGPSFDSVYIDVIAVWCPTRLVMADHNEWLGDSDTYAWTFNKNVKLPRLTKLATGQVANGQKISKAYYAEHYRAPHYGCRYFNDSATLVDFTSTTFSGAKSRWLNGVQVIPSRQYDLIFNTLFRNQNITSPKLFSKQSGTDLSLDVTNYQSGLGELWQACRLKNFVNTARLSPSIQTVDILQGLSAPVVTKVDTYNVAGNVAPHYVFTATSASANGTLGLTTSGALTTNGVAMTNNGAVAPDNMYAQLAGLTVNSLYYSIMLQRFFNKASTGRRPVEFYQEFFGIENSAVAANDPQLLSQKRFKVNISRIVATSNSTDAQSNIQPLGTQGAYSITAGNGTLFPTFTATEYGMLHVFAVIRTQESRASGIDRYLSDYDLLSTYIPTFDHIGDDYIDNREIRDWNLATTQNIFGYQQAWYNYRQHMSDVVGILSPGEPLDFYSLARYELYGGSTVINDDYIMQSPFEFDRMLQFPVCYNPSGINCDIDGEPYESNRYQWILQFAVAGDFARTMSKDSEQLMF